MKSFLEISGMFAKKIPTETIIRDFMINFLKETCEIEIDRKYIILSKNMIQLQISPIIRSKFVPYQDICLSELNKHLKEQGVKLVIKRIM